MRKNILMTDVIARAKCSKNYKKNKKKKHIHYIVSWMRINVNTLTKFCVAKTIKLLPANRAFSVKSNQICKFLKRLMQNLPIDFW